MSVCVLILCTGVKVGFGLIWVCSSRSRLIHDGGGGGGGGWEGFGL